MISLTSELLMAFALGCNGTLYVDYFSMDILPFLGFVCMKLQLWKKA